MSRHALLIASPYGDLSGPVSDVKKMAELLKPRGFGIRTCAGLEAARDRILAAYRSLIDDARDADAVVIYYSGHGARSLDEAYVPVDQNAPPKRYHHFIVPIDF